MTSPLVTVIIPFFNTELYIAQAIDSILNQSFQNFELLLINDASFDASQKIILTYSDTRIVLINNETNKGPSYCRNIGIKLAKGKYIAFLDSDDIAFPNRLQLQLQFMEEHPNIAVCGCYAEYFGFKKGIWKYPELDSEIKCRLLWGSSIIQSTAIIKKSILIESGILYDDNYAASEDYKLWVDISQFSDLYNIPEVLVKYRTHGEQLTVTKSTQMNINKTEIIINQIKQMGVLVTDVDFDIFYKFITYQYDFSIKELNRLVEIYSEFIVKNNQIKRYNQTLVKEQIDERIFEACYFSTKKCGYKAIEIFKSKFEIQNLSFDKKVKFYIKSLLK
jgi:glycosyltransferase involved in cell wall biosynthesis